VVEVDVMESYRHRYYFKTHAFTNLCDSETGGAAAIGLNDYIPRIKLNEVVKNGPCRGGGGQ
jgi:hypothetical protein